MFICVLFQYRAWSTPETVSQTALALQTGVDTLTFYEDFFGIKFPIPKQGLLIMSFIFGKKIREFFLFIELKQVKKIQIFEKSNNQWSKVFFLCNISSRIDIVILFSLE